MLFFDGRHRNLMPYLKRLREYPGGAESAKALAESWKTEYKRRPAMAKTFSDMHGRRLVIRQYVPFPMLHVVQVP